MNNMQSDHCEALPYEPQAATEKINPFQLRRFLKTHKKKLFFVIALIFCGVLTVALSNWFIINSTRGQVYNHLENLPPCDVALVLGSSIISYHCGLRLDAAAALYKAGKVRHLLVSGDNHIRSYDEPSDMKNELLRRGVPATAITCDYAGFRTLDSVVRASRIFGQRRLIIVTQRFHTYRSLAIARHEGIDAVAYCAGEVPPGYRRGPELREVLARTLAVVDLYILHRQPKFLGKPEVIG